jgi:hypothetical protein
VTEALAVAASASLIACGSAEDAAGPLAAGGSADIAIPSAVGHELTYGQVTLGNESDSPLTIDRIDVDHDEGNHQGRDHFVKRVTQYVTICSPERRRCEHDDA